MKQRRILISRPDRLGDLVITSACFASVKGIAPEVRLAVLANPAFGSLWEGNDCVDVFIPLVEGWEQKVCEFGPDVSIHSEPKEEVAVVCEQIGVPMRVGYESERAHLTHVLPYTKDQGKRHELDYVFELLRVWEPDLSSEGCLPTLSAAPLPKDVSIDGEYGVIHLGSHGSKATVPTAVYRELAQWLITDRGWSVLLIGGEEESALSEAFRKEVGTESMVSLCGKLSSAQTFGLLKQARLFLGRDSGPAHLAAAAGTETFVFMPASRPDISVTRWKPLGPKVTVLGPQGKARFWEKTEQANQRAFGRIEVAEVKARIAEKLPEK